MEQQGWICLQSYSKFNASELDNFRLHYHTLESCIKDHVDKSQEMRLRKLAEEKLAKLTMKQFNELSTDIYDEINRRESVKSGIDDIPFLPLKEDYHPRRNQARQKLATLSDIKFKDLVQDVYFEISRRVFKDNDKKEMKKSASAVAERKDQVKVLKKSSSETAFQEEVPGNLNFDSLDHLMADLGEMMETHLDAKTPPAAKKSPSGGLNIDDLMNQAQNDVEKAKKKTHRNQSIDKITAEFASSKDSILKKSPGSADSLRSRNASNDSIKGTHKIFSASTEELKPSKEKAKELQPSVSKELFSSYISNEKNSLELLSKTTAKSYKIDDFSEYSKSMIRDLTHEIELTDCNDAFKTLMNGVMENFLKEILKFAANSKKHKNYLTKTVMTQDEISVETKQEKSLLYIFLEKTDTLIKASRKSDEQSFLVEISKEVMSSTKDITELADSIEKMENKEDLESLRLVKTKVYQALSNLLNISKELSSSSDLVYLNAFDLAVSNLNSLVIDLWRLISIRTVSQTERKVQPTKQIVSREPATKEIAAAEKDTRKKIVDKITDEIVQGIEELLSSIKSTFLPESIKRIIHSITENVSRLTRIASESPSDTLKSAVAVLNERNQVLKDATSDISEGSEKKMKQRIATHAYDVATATKSVVDLLEK